MWMGFNSTNGVMNFLVPEKYKDILTEVELDNKNQLIKQIRNTSWFTNLDYKERHEDLILYEKYSSTKYLTYDNYNAINVDSVKEIPKDYDGIMGVPITYLDKHSPEQFEIVALGNSRDNFTPIKDYINPIKVMKDGKQVSGGAINCVLAINVKNKPSDTHYISENSDYLIAPYARILIKRIK